MVVDGSRCQPAVAVKPPGLQCVGIISLDAERFQVLENGLAERGFEVAGDNLGITLIGFAGNVGLRIVAQPAIKVVPQGFPRGIDIGALVDCVQNAVELALGIPLGASDGGKSGLPLAVLVAAYVVFNPSRAFPAALYVAIHVSLPTTSCSFVLIVE